MLIQHAYEPWSLNWTQEVELIIQILFTTEESQVYY